MDIHLNNCFICDEKIKFYCKNQFKIVSKHSETPIYKFLEKFTGQTFFESDIISKSILCKDCVLRINEYDLATTTAAKVKNELIELIKRTQFKLNLEKINDDIELENDVDDYGNDVDDAKCDYLDEEIDEKFAIKDENVVMKCNICNETFSTVKDMSSHTHKIISKDTEKEQIIKCGKDEFIINFKEEHEIIDSKELEGSTEPSEIDSENYTYYILDSEDVEHENEENDSMQKEGERIAITEFIEEDQKKSFPNKKTKGPHNCMICNKVFMAKTEFRIHLKTHEDSKLICYVCGSFYKSKPALDNHVKMHQGISSHECSVCGKKFTQKGALQRHMPIHTGEKSYQCEVCGKQFIHYSSFHMHKLAHDDIREKECKICGLHLRSSSHLTRHLRVHSGEKPFACPTCGQRFAQRYNMMTHYKVHQGIHRPNRNHSCVVCNKSFPRKAKLEEHMKLFHQNDDLLNKKKDDCAGENDIAVDYIPDFEITETD